MEKLDKHQSKEYGPVVMWADDLVELFSLFSECSKVEFVADDVKFESADEFIKESNGRTPKVVKITASNPYLSIELNAHSARLYVSSSRLLAAGLFHKIDSILHRCQRKPRFFYRFAWALGASWILPNIFLLPALKPYGYLSIWVTGVTLTWMAYISYIHLRRYSILRPVLRENNPSFVRRNSDAIVVAVISALLGAIGGAGATKVADRVWPNAPSPILGTDTQPAKPQQ